ncbi:hypothetical protein AcW1_010015 [Taiwanofungus camphoratus]|nr:hypothetical protein AcV7_005360 [Antrodia cinnamomea]KAI0946586.1 hypothetical protein AcW1_010015 [Antrodia cinnamomea]
MGTVSLHWQSFLRLDKVPSTSTLISCEHICHLWMHTTLMPSKLCLTSWTGRVCLSKYPRDLTRSPINFRPGSNAPIDALMRLVSSEHGQELLRHIRGQEAETCINLLDQALARIGSNEPRYTTTYHTLTKLCVRAKSFPRSFILPKTELVKTNDRSLGGGQAMVYLGRYRNQDVALKVLRIYDKRDVDGVTEGFTTKPHRYNGGTKEAVVWHHLRQRNIVKFIGISNSLFPGLICIVSQWMHNGTIMSYLNRNPTADRRNLILDVVAGLECLTL